MKPWLTHVPQPPPVNVDEAVGFTRIRLVDELGSTIGLIWTHGEADREYVRSLIPDGCKAMVAWHVWPE